MRFPRRILPLLAAAFLLPPSGARAARRMPKPLPIRAVSAAASRVGSGAGGGPSCGMGELSPWGDTQDYILTPPEDVYFTLLRLTDCASCAAAETALVSRVHVALDVRKLCTGPIPVTASVVGAAGPDACPTPNLAAVLCGPDTFLLAPSQIDTTDFVLTLSRRCMIVGRAFLRIGFPDTALGCGDTLSRPKIVLGETGCTQCISYNDYDYDGVPNDMCFPETYGNPAMYAEVDFCYPPPPVSNLEIVSIAETSVRLRWDAIGDVSGAGRPMEYLVAAATRPLDEASFAGSVRDSLPATVNPPGHEFLDVGLERAQSYWFAVKARDASGHSSALSNIVAARTPLGGPVGGRVRPAIASLIQPALLPVQIYWVGTGGSSRQRIKILDLAGRLMRTIDLGGDPDGVALWDGKDDDGESVPSGLYVARLTSGSKEAGARILLVR